MQTQKTIKKTEISRILERIELINSEQSVKNEDIFGPVDNNGTLAVIVVQVHNRIQYLRQLIISFSQVILLFVLLYKLHSKLFGISRRNQ